MSRLTLEISSAIEAVVHERLLDGLRVLLSESDAGYVIENQATSSGSIFVLLSQDDECARTLIDEILDNEQINVAVTLSTGQEVPVLIRGAALPAMDPVHDSIIGSFSNLDGDVKSSPRNCLYCRHFSMRSSMANADIEMRCAKSMDDGTFSEPLPMTFRPYKTVLLLREAIEVADKCEFFQKD